MNSSVMKLQHALNAPGKTPLWVAFWLYGVLVSQVLFFAVLKLYGSLSSPAFGLVLLGFVAYTGWVLNCVWRNADNVQNPNYAQIARFLTVAWSINSVLVSAFLWLEHLKAGALPLPF